MTYLSGLTLKAQEFYDCLCGIVDRHCGCIVVDFCGLCCRVWTGDPHKFVKLTKTRFSDKAREVCLNRFHGSSFDSDDTAAPVNELR